MHMHMHMHMHMRAMSGSSSIVVTEETRASLAAAMEV